MQVWSWDFLSVCPLPTPKRKLLFLSLAFRALWDLVFHLLGPESPKPNHKMSLVSKPLPLSIRPCTSNNTADVGRVLWLVMLRHVLYPSWNEAEKARIRQSRIWEWEMGSDLSPRFTEQEFPRRRKTLRELASDEVHCRNVTGASTNSATHVDDTPWGKEDYMNKAQRGCPTNSATCGDLGKSESSPFQLAADCCSVGLLLSGAGSPAGRPPAGVRVRAWPQRPWVSQPCSWKGCCGAVPTSRILLVAKQGQQLSQPRREWQPKQSPWRTEDVSWGVQGAEKGKVTRD